MISIGGVTLIYGLTLAWRTRTISYKLANDSKYIGFTIYNVAIYASIAVIINYTISDITLRTTLVAVLIITATTGSLCLMFLPKVRNHC